MNPMRAMKLIVGKWMAGRGGLWRSASAVAGYAVLGISLAGGRLIAAQEPDASAATSDPSAAQALSQLDDLMRGGDATHAEDMAPPNDVNLTNGLPESNSPTSSGGGTNRVNRFDAPSPSQNDDRRSRGRRSRSRSNQRGGSGSANDYGGDRTQGNALGGTNNGPASLDYSAFKVIVDRNIFDPTRYPHIPGAPVVTSKPKSFDSLKLVGIISYEKGTFAFFDGTSSEYTKVLKLTDSIAGYKVTNIAPNAVKLVSGTNEVELSVGAQLRREENGPWLLASQPTSYAATPGSISTSGASAAGADAASSGADSDIIKRLMQKREKE
jgi:hypothetical protein